MTAPTPMMRQYRRIKQEHGDAILFFRLGDFYEMFEKDAREVSSLLNITLTSRHNIPMCGIPYHAAQSYIARLLREGKKIAICEQISLPQDGKGIADRKVVEIITPGTVTEESFLDKSSNNYLVALGRTGDFISFASIDLSTGNFQATAYSWENRGEMLKRDLARLVPREILIQESLVEEDFIVGKIIQERPNLMLNRFPDWHFDMDTSREMLIRQFKVANLKGFGIETDDPAILSTGVLLEYVEDSSKSLTPHILGINIYGEKEFVGLDEATQKNLELIRNLQDGSRKYTLLEVLDHTLTAMGARKLKSWLLAPLNTAEHIESRQKVVEVFYRNQLLLSALRQELGAILDLERLSARVALDKAHAKDLLAIKNTLIGTQKIHVLLQDWTEPWTMDGDKVQILSKSQQLLEAAIHEDPSVVLTEGRLIKTGYEPELDRLRGLKANSQAILNEYLEQEKQKSGISNLRIRYNKIIGYFLEVTKSNLKQVPENFIRRQSLVGSERFTTDRLVELETDLNSTSGLIIEMEKTVFLDVREQIKAAIPVFLEVANHLAQIDCYCSFAHAATIHGYTKPNIKKNKIIHIDEGRHPVVEAHIPAGEFIPNGLTIDSDGVSFALITGPNMAGKSTYLRQTALVVLMAQIGCFVPAKEAHIGLVDRIFCRVGASDNLARGESTFLVEMNETANILRSSTDRSLVIMDEVGRGTSTNDGLSIAWAVIEFLLGRAAKTLFATHFHELTFIEHEKKINLALSVLEREDEIVFLKKIRQGSANHSYGIHVARMAGIPEEVIGRATGILKRLIERERTEANAAAATQKSAPEQADLFSNEELICKKIVGLDVNRTTPLEALKFIAKLKEDLGHIEKPPS